MHLLPVFDFATVPEKKADQRSPDCDLASYPADSDRQQACVAKSAAQDAYNWGYDPYHFTVPEARTPPTPTAPRAPGSSGRWCRGSTRTACGS